MDPGQFSLVMNSGVDAGELQGKAEETFLNNVTAAFLLLHNLEKFEMEFLDVSYVTSRDRVENWFGPAWID
ncbi:hypothetical protein [Sporosarcina sp. Te-1]|uniref:hypothetical protein n=1 Tax=Sporosarcina sp. Te-1 TaxID=2818390 RepID=UPI001A9E64E2|nr:hypothetical protein [Sporosarcina sp. Te-1]QTD41364.1 hypothetical protein J3U78_00365 [Sporosarcina sp. Te-1]